MNISDTIFVGDASKSKGSESYLKSKSVIANGATESLRQQEGSSQPPYPKEVLHPIIGVSSRSKLKDGQRSLDEGRASRVFDKSALKHKRTETGVEGSTDDEQSL